MAKFIVQLKSPFFRKWFSNVGKALAPEGKKNSLVGSNGEGPCVQKKPKCEKFEQEMFTLKKWNCESVLKSLQECANEARRRAINCQKEVMKGSKQEALKKIEEGRRCKEDTVQRCGLLPQKASVMKDAKCDSGKAKSQSEKCQKDDCDTIGKILSKDKNELLARKKAKSAKGNGASQKVKKSGKNKKKEQAKEAKKGASVEETSNKPIEAKKKKEASDDRQLEKSREQGAKDEVCEQEMKSEKAMVAGADKKVEDKSKLAASGRDKKPPSKKPKKKKGWFGFGSKKKSAVKKKGELCPDKGKDKGKDKGIGKGKGKGGGIKCGRDKTDKDGKGPADPCKDIKGPKGGKDAGKGPADPCKDLKGPKGDKDAGKGVADPCKDKKPSKDTGKDKKDPTKDKKDDKGIGKDKKEPSKDSGMGKKSTSDPCKDKKDSGKSKKDPCDPCKDSGQGKKKTSDPCKQKKDPCDPCKDKKDVCDPCKNKKDVCDPCKDKKDSGKKKNDPCDPCKDKKDSGKGKKDPYDPCKDKDSGKGKKDPCDPCKDKKDSGKEKKDPCKNKKDECDPCKDKKGDKDSGKSKQDPCDPCKNKKQSICDKEKEDPCKKKNPCKKDPCKDQQDSGKGKCDPNKDKKNTKRDPFDKDDDTCQFSKNAWVAKYLQPQSGRYKPGQSYLDLISRLSTIHASVQNFDELFVRQRVEEDSPFIMLRSLKDDTSQMLDSLKRCVEERKGSSSNGGGEWKKSCKGVTNDAELLDSKHEIGIAPRRVEGTIFVEEEETKKMAEDAAEVVLNRALKNVMQQGTDNTHHWKLNFPRSTTWENPLMGWCCSADKYAGLSLKFGSVESAAEFCKKKGWETAIEASPKPRVPVKKDYSANFSWDRRTRVSTK